METPKNHLAFGISKLYEMRGWILAGLSRKKQITCHESRRDDHQISKTTRSMEILSEADEAKHETDATDETLLMM
ncbi:hypothetical protein E2C01_036260 [Portunus trituberculatus]|uniref:Uncharacterized protein n=1 Tax=Portunus trituberculatus TaxID=210409 RepID=A0A5B7FDR9_PORTR|nr:hypothetical protein [Portunus trituberculatus]